MTTEDPAETAQDRADRVRASLGSLYDRQMSPMGLAAIEAMAPKLGETILDVGCGAGETIVQLADRVGPTGQVIGVDIGRHVLAVARERTAHLPNVGLLQEDAALLGLPDGHVDAVYSRFGASFFADPVAAFANLRRMIRSGGRIAFTCWRSLRENEVDFLPLDAAGLTIDFDPSSFSFERREMIERVLAAARFDGIEIAASDISVAIGDVDESLRLVTQVGPLGIILRENPALLAQVEPKVRALLRSRERDGQVSLGTATWIVTAIA